MNIVHPPYTTNDYWLKQVNLSAIEVPAWKPLEEMHPCDLQSSMLKGCTPVPNNGSDPEDTYGIHQEHETQDRCLCLYRTTI